MKRLGLEGKAFVLEGIWGGKNPLIPLIGKAEGAGDLSQMALQLDGPSPIFRFGKFDVILFVIEGDGEAQIGSETFNLGARSGLYIRPFEAFQVRPKGSLKGLLTVCPEEDTFRVLKTLPTNFDKDFPNRAAFIDPAKKEAMGERFFQVLVSKHLGSKNVTQFIGEIPKSRAPSHHHLYEEALYILDGEGVMWTGDQNAPVKPGSVIFLPIRQDHSLECTSEGGLVVAGHFYPAGSPAENY